jgi:photosystem II stability/assembly factor-like uncharacterized protein
VSRGTKSLLITILGLILLAPAARAQARPERQPPRPPTQQPRPGPADTGTFAQLKYRYIGPVGNRVAAVAGVVSDPSVYYAGAASGGIWKTTDGGVHWQPIFDDQPVQSIGALAVAPSDPNVVWAGTGEAWIRSHISIGNGIYKSTDAGKTWQHVGLDNTGRIARIVVHPGNPDVVYVAALGHSYGPQQERGIYRTSDGGKTWERVLFVDENTGAVDVVMDPTNPRILFAAMWQLEIHTWGRESGGPGSGIYTSRDGGTTWKKLTGHGLPTKPFGKVGLAIAPSNASRIYALIETGDGVPWHGQATDNGELWRSDDGGETWKVVSYDRQLSCRQPYYTRMAVAPDRENEAYFLCASFSKTLDGGATTVDVPFAQSPGGDNHDMWIDPTNGNRMIVGNDGQASISTTRGRTWYRQQLPIAQMYHATVDNQIPYYVMGNRQDGPSSRGPSNSRIGGGGGGGGGAGLIPRGEWHSVAGGESGWATPDPTDPNIIWSSASGSGSVGGIVARYDERTRQALHAEIWPQSTIGWPAADVKYRFVWTAPLTISPHDHNKVYVGSQFVHVTTDGGKSWQIISPDLTLNDKSKQQISGGLTPDNIGVEYADVVFAIAESPLKPGLIWAGTNDGLVQVTRDGGKSWSNVTSGIPGMPAWGTVSNIEPSRYDTATAYITVDAHQANIRDPLVYKTTDYGRSWKPIVSGLPRSPTGYAHVIREDPVRRGLLYLGTESALYVSFDDGESWQPLQTTLPHTPVYWLVLQEHFNDLVVSTYGRGFWILDDVTPLQQLTADVRSQAAYLFKPRPAYRFRQITAPMAMTDDPTAGQNPPYGAAINYWLTSASTGGGEVTLTVLDAGGQTLRTLQGTKNAGINRVWWDLRSDSTKAARLRTAPLYDPELRLGAEGWRAAPGVGRMTVLVPPGTYTLKLKVGGQELSQQLVVRKDPNSGGTEADIQSQAKLLAALQGDLNSAVDMINRIEVVRSQLQNLRSLLPSDLKARADSLEKKFSGVENSLVDLRLTGRGQDDVRWPTMLAGQLAYLAQGIASSDFAPTMQQSEVSQLLEGQLKAVGTQLDGLLNQDLAQFNAALKQQNVGNVVPGTP